MSGRWVWAIGLASLVAMTWWGADRAFSAWRFESSLVQARKLMQEKRFPEAETLLSRLPSRWSNDAEASYRLGVCQHVSGRIDAALASWSRIGPGSPWSLHAGLAEARTLVGDAGRFADAETILEGLMARLRPSESQEVRYTLSKLYFWEGRRDAIRRLLERGWSTTSDPIEDLRDSWRVDHAPTMIEKVREAIDNASKLAPDDDRVWLARANLEIQTGRLDEASTWLDRCETRRPDDPAVWRSRLDLARASNDPSAVLKALQHLPASSFTEAERLALRSWLASKRGDADRERQALERQLEIDPGDNRALERLATLAWDAGQTERAREYRSRKAELDRIKDRYRALIDAPITPSQFAELGKLSQSLGRRFEARGWWSLRAVSAPSDPDATTALALLRDHPDAPRSVPDDILPKLISTSDRAMASQSKPSTPSTTQPRFRDDAESAGLSFVFDNGRSPLRQIPETTAGGVGLLDFDGDGLLDVYVVQGGTFPPRPALPNTGDRLFRNKGNGSFEDVTERSGIGRMPRRFGHGVTVGDFDNDGFPDLFLTRWRGYALYRNRGDGTFEDVTAKAGLDGDRDWPTSAAFADLDNDGDLDLYVCHYLKWDAEHPTLCNRVTSTAASERVDPDQKYNYCTPRPFAALPDHLFRNDGGRFVDVTAEAGIVDKDGRGLGVVAADVDGDGLVDLFVANDTTANYLWHNLGGMRFEETGLANGVACNADGAFQAGMGTACGDLDGDGRPDLLVTNFYGESTTFFRNLGHGVFSDQTSAIGLAAPTRYLLGFGITLLDVDNDGRLDLAIANGHVNDDRPDYPYDMPTSLLMGGEGGHLTDVTQAAGSPWTIPRVSRGLAAGDLDNDGKIDALLLPQKSPLVYFHNQTSAGHSLTFQLEGTTSNRDGVGAVVAVVAGGRELVRTRCGGGSYQSASDPRLHFGIGTERRVEKVEVRWPSGRVDRFGPLDGDRVYRLREGTEAPMPIPGQAF
jgi:tetratricopeptide (TPR) repeat protein